jgi:hypothetical protein
VLANKTGNRPDMRPRCAHADDGWNKMGEIAALKRSSAPARPDNAQSRGFIFHASSSTGIAANAGAMPVNPSVVQLARPKSECMRRKYRLNSPNLDSHMEMSP